jgi:hypothetical protein
LVQFAYLDDGARHRIAHWLLHGSNLCFGSKTRIATFSEIFHGTPRAGSRRFRFRNKPEKLLKTQGTPQKSKPTRIPSGTHHEPTKTRTKPTKNEDASRDSLVLANGPMLLAEARWNTLSSRRVTTASLISSRVRRRSGQNSEAAKLAPAAATDPDAAHQSAAKPFHGFRFHDLPHKLRSWSVINYLRFQAVVAT